MFWFIAFLGLLLIASAIMRLAEAVERRADRETDQPDKNFQPEDDEEQNTPKGFGVYGSYKHPLVP